MTAGEPNWRRFGVLHDLADQHGLTFAFGYVGRQKAWTFTCVRPAARRVVRSCIPARVDLFLTEPPGRGCLDFLYVDNSLLRRAKSSDSALTGRSRLRPSTSCSVQSAAATSTCATWPRCSSMRGRYRTRFKTRLSEPFQAEMTRRDAQTGACASASCPCGSFWLEPAFQGLARICSVPHLVHRAVYGSRVFTSACGAAATSSLFVSNATCLFQEPDADSTHYWYVFLGGVL